MLRSTPAQLIKDRAMFIDSELAEFIHKNSKAISQKCVQWQYKVSQFSFGENFVLQIFLPSIRVHNTKIFSNFFFSFKLCVKLLLKNFNLYSLYIVSQNVSLYIPVLKIIACVVFIEFYTTYQRQND